MGDYTTLEGSVGVQEQQLELMTGYRWMLGKF